MVFAITDTLLHNYLLPRDCPRVTIYPKPDTNPNDRERFLGASKSKFVIAVERSWYPAIQNAVLFCYEFPVDTFNVLDKGAGYYVSYEVIVPISIQRITDAPAELLARNVELRVMPSISNLADEVSQSTLQYSLIRMRNAKRY